MVDQASGGRSDRGIDLKKSRSRARTTAPIDWIESASADEIGEAFLAVDEAKAAAVAIYLARRTAPELKRMLDSAGEALEKDPLTAVVGMMISGIRRSSR